jgi:tripartite-type tricarboxylate transporter receptor subunit TctC
MQAAGRRFRVIAALLLGLAGLLAGSQPARAQGYPSRPIRIVIGPSPDVFARVIAQHLQETWGQPVVVEPRPGAGGKIAATAVSTAEPDGHTLLFATPSYTLNTAMKLASYDFVNDFDAVSLFGLIAYALVVHPSVPAQSVPELVAYAKAHPGAVNCASAGIGTVPHLACEVLAEQAGAKIVHVPYRDVNAGLNGVVSGQVQMFFGVSAPSKGQIEAGTVRGLAVTSEQRSALLPALPTMVESGFPRFAMPGWGGLMAPKGTPKDVVEKLNAEIARGLEKPEVQARLAALGMEAPPPYGPAQVGDFVRADIARWTAFVEAVGVDRFNPTGPNR